MAVAVALAFGRFAWLYLLAPAQARASPAPSRAGAARARRASSSHASLLASSCSPIRRSRWRSPAAPGSIKWIDNFGIQILIYVMLGWGLNIVVGLAGLLDLGYVAFYAVGAYSYALLASSRPSACRSGMPACRSPASSRPSGASCSGFPVLRLRGDYLAIVTLAFGEIVRLVLINWVPVTGGYAGISGIPKPSLFGLPFTPRPDGFAAVLRPAAPRRSTARSSCST